MERLRKAIMTEGKYLGRGILKVDSFINHQIDPALMVEIGQELARRFMPLKPTKVLTAEVSGIAPAIATAMVLGVPLIFARKTRPITMPAEVYHTQAPSHTKGSIVDLMVSPEVLGPDERVLIIDDFLARGLTLQALAELVKLSGSTLCGFGVIIEKSFEDGRSLLSGLGVPIESLAVITSLSDEGIECE
jgi:xanthine phosphoribosyltransferase